MSRVSKLFWARHARVQEISNSQRRRPCHEAYVTVEWKILENSFVPGLYPILVYLVLLTLVGAFAGIRLAEIPSISQRFLPFSGGILVGVAVFWILPEIAEHYGWIGGAAGMLAGFAALWLIDHHRLRGLPRLFPHAQSRYLRTQIAWLRGATAHRRQPA